MGHLTKIATRIAQNAQVHTNSTLIKDKLEGITYS